MTILGNFPQYKPELNALRNWCRRCGSTRLLFLPDDFQRRRENTTKLDREEAIVNFAKSLFIEVLRIFVTFRIQFVYYNIFLNASDRDRGVIEWKVGLVFPQAAGGERDVQLDGVDDSTRIHELFRPYVDTEEREADFEDPFLPYR